jgi:hypothetical protein
LWWPRKVEAALPDHAKGEREEAALPIRISRKNFEKHQISLGDHDEPTAARLFAPSQSMRGMEMDEGKARTQGDVEMDFACRNSPRRIRVRSIIGG